MAKLPSFTQRPTQLCTGPQGLDLVFYGDSITENWLGTSLGRPWPGGKGVAAVYRKHFGGYKSAVLAIAGASLHSHKPGINSAAK